MFSRLQEPQHCSNESSPSKIPVRATVKEYLTRSSKIDRRSSAAAMAVTEMQPHAVRFSMYADYEVPSGRFEKYKLVLELRRPKASICADGTYHAIM